LRYAASSECRACQGNLLLDTANIDDGNLDSVANAQMVMGCNQAVCVLFNIRSQ